jgi:thiol-disulfide isomerase/thioredoxin
MHLMGRTTGRVAGLALWTFCGLVEMTASAQQAPEDALKLLDRVAKHYENAETVHIEVTRQETSHAEGYDSSQTITMSAYEAPGGRFRYEGTGWTGSGLIVSDATNEWRLRRSYRQYSKKPTGTYFKPGNALQGDDAPVLYAHYLRSNLNSLGSQLQSAHFLANETISVGDHKVQCVIVHYNEKDATRQFPGHKEETSLWIDPVALTLLKEERRSQSTLGFGNLPLPPYGTVIDRTEMETYTVMELDFEPQAETFTFHPPEGAMEVADLPDPFGRSTSGNPSAAGQEPVDSKVGKMAPDLKLVDNAGHEVALSSYRGHPLLIDLWATWCGPCLQELSLLGRIRTATAGTDLKMIAIDEDSKPLVAADLLKRKNYDWENFHFNRSVTAALPSAGIPLLVLVDASGKIVYYHTGVGDEAAMVEAISKLGKDYEGVNSVR